MAYQMFMKYTNNQSIYKTDKTDATFVQMDSSIIRANLISIESKGLLLTLLDNASYWDFHVNNIAKRCNKTKYATLKLIKELKTAGHIEHICYRNYKNRILKWKYLVHERPLPLEERFDYIIVKLDKYGNLDKILSKKRFDGVLITMENNNTKENFRQHCELQNPVLQHDVNGGTNNNNLNNNKKEKKNNNNKDIENIVKKIKLRLSKKVYKKPSIKIKETVIEETNDNYKKLTKCEIDAIKIDIETVTESTVNEFTLRNFIKQNQITIDQIKYYLKHWHNFDYKSKENPVGFFLYCVGNNVDIPDRQQGKNTQDKPIQSYNFEQRPYDDSEEIFLYQNLPDEGALKKYVLDKGYGM